MGLFALVALTATACYVPTETGERDVLRTNLWFPFTVALLGSLAYLGWAVGEILKVRPKDFWPGREGTLIVFAGGATFIMALLSLGSATVLYVSLGIGVPIIGWAFAGFIAQDMAWSSTPKSRKEVASGIAARCAQYTGIATFPVVALLFWVVFYVTRT